MNELRTKADSGASAAEYALLVSLIALVVLASVVAFGGSVGDLFGNSCTQVARATVPADC